VGLLVHSKEGNPERPRRTSNYSTSYRPRVELLRLGSGAAHPDEQGGVWLIGGGGLPTFQRVTPGGPRIPTSKTWDVVEFLGDRPRRSPAGRVRAARGLDPESLGVVTYNMTAGQFVAFDAAGQPAHGTTTGSAWTRLNERITWQ